MAPGNARHDLWADAHSGDGQRLHARARGFATGHHELAHTFDGEPARDRCQRGLHERTGSVDAEFLLGRFHRSRLRRGIDQHRAVGKARARAVQRLRDQVDTTGQLQRVDREPSATGVEERLHLAIGRHRGAARHDGPQTLCGGQLRCRRAALAHVEVLWESDGDARAAGHQRQIGPGGTHRHELRIGRRIHDRNLRALGAELRDVFAHGLRTADDALVIDEAHLARCLRLQHPHEIGVGHRRERMVAHARLMKQFVANVQIALEHRSTVVGERGTGDGEIAAHRPHQGIRDRANVAGRRGIEGGTVLEVDLANALLAQPLQCVERLCHCIRRRDRAALERHDDSVGLFFERGIGHPDRLHNAHAPAHKIVGEVGGAREIVGNAAQNGVSHGKDSRLLLLVLMAASRTRQRMAGKAQGVLRVGTAQAAAATRATTSRTIHSGLANTGLPVRWASGSAR